MKPADQIVIMGLTGQKKPCAARFDAAQADAVRKAAALMGLQVGIARTEDTAQLVAKLPPGKLFAAGRGLVPLVKASLYGELTKKLVLEAAPAVQPASEPPEGRADKPKTVPAMSPAPSGDPWAAIRVGSTVVAPEKNPAEDGWWRATVTAVSKDGARLTLRWLDAPKQPAVTLKRHAVALLPS